MKHEEETSLASACLASAKGCSNDIFYRHGFQGSVEMWEEALRELATQSRTKLDSITVSVVGISTTCDYDYTLVKPIASVLDFAPYSTKIGRIVLVGVTDLRLGHVRDIAKRFKTTVEVQISDSFTFTLPVLKHVWGQVGTNDVLITLKRPLETYKKLKGAAAWYKNRVILSRIELNVASVDRHSLLPLLDGDGLAAGDFICQGDDLAGFCW